MPIRTFQVTLKIIYAMIILLTMSCFESSKPKEDQKSAVINPVDDQLPQIIKMRLPISKAKPLYLSEIAESIEYIRLETTKENLVGRI